MRPRQIAGRPRVAVIGAGISGLSCAWLLSKSCEVTLYEAAPHLGGHSDTVEWCGVGVDNGFIVYNERTYPNLTALFAHLGVTTRESEMSFGVSRDGGRFEYAGGDWRGLFAQPSNLGNPAFWSMLKDILRFFRQASADADREVAGTLADYLDAGGYGAPFRERYLYPMAAAIWSTPAMDVGAHSAQAFLRFNRNHGLLDLVDRPVWRTVEGGSRNYVRRLADALGHDSVIRRRVSAVSRQDGAVMLLDDAGEHRRFDQVVLATHPDEALRLIAAPSEAEQRLLGVFSYGANDAVMHTDTSAMPRRRAAWSSWNYLADSAAMERRPSITYWMNRLQGLNDVPPVFVTLNPLLPIDPALVVRQRQFRHPLFTQATLAAQKQLWSLQGAGGLWFCGAWFGAGFHEDGLQAGLAVAEAIGEVRRPWRVAAESGRIFLPQAGVHPVASLVEPALFEPAM